MRGKACCQHINTDDHLNLLASSGLPAKYLMLPVLTLGIPAAEVNQVYQVVPSPNGATAPNCYPSHTRV